MRPMRLLALSPVPHEGAGCRFRISQYVPYLESQGISVTVAPFYDREFFGLVYQRGRHARKAWCFAKQTLARLATIAGAARYDAVLIYREAFPLGPPVLETLLGALRRPIVYDFDDAVFLPNTSDANRYVAALKYPGKIASIIRRSAEVVAGNDYLAAFARRVHASVHVIPTSVDTDLFVPRAEPPAAGSRPVVGWIGTPTTSPYLVPLAAPLAALAREHAFTVRIAGAGDDLSLPGVAAERPAWSLDREVALFNTCDVGLNPLPDSEWAKGKCGFKAIQFMACGVPVVASPVGVNPQIVEDGVNGFLADTADEWRRAIGRLLADAALRRSMGEAARRTVEQRYSLRVNAPRLAGVIRRAVERRAVAQAIASPAGDRR